MPDKFTNKQNPLMSLWKYFDAFWKRTNISGISNAGSTKSTFRRTCWMVTFTIFLITTIMGFREVFREYFANQVVTSVTIEHQDKVSKRIILPFISMQLSCINVGLS